MAQKMKHTMGERLNIRFNGKIKLEFHGARLTSDGGLLAYRELDEALGLFNSASDIMNDRRTGHNIQHDVTNLMRLILPSNIKHWSIRTLVVKLIKIGAKVLRHSHYVIFQLAEVAIRKDVFAGILSRINRLRCCSQQ